MKPYTSDTISKSSQLTMHKDSHSISKLKPKVRIIHIIAPQIIKTDVENFRELVQRLTGKHAAERKRNKNKERRHTRKDVSNDKIMGSSQDHNCQTRMLQGMYRMKEEKSEESIYGTENSSNGYLSTSFGMEGFNIQDFGEFPVFPFKSSQINMFGEMPLC